MPAIVFDFDGVIVDSEPMHEAALRRTLAARGWEMSHESYIREYVGLADREILRAVALAHGRTLSPEELAELGREKSAHVHEAAGRGEPPAAPGVVDLVRDAGRRGPVGLCSGALRREILPILTRLGIADAFGTIVTCDDVPHAKPDPTGYRLTASRLQTPPGECVAIEDTLVGIRAAKDAGYKVVAVTQTFPRERLAHADLVVGRVGELTVERLLALL